MVVHGVTYGFTPTGTGQTIRERMWEALDDAMDRMMESGTPADLPSGFDERALREWKAQVQAFAKDQGIAESTAYILAMFENPIFTSIDEIRGQAFLRWQDRQESTIDSRTADSENSNVEQDQESPEEAVLSGQALSA